MKTGLKKMTEVIVAIVGLAGVAVTAYYGYRSSVDKKHLESQKKQAIAEINVQRKALDFGHFVQEWDRMTKQLTELMDGTCIDRFLLLRAWNGKLAPRWTTAVFQFRHGGEQQPIQYVHFELDQDYISRLIQTVEKNCIKFTVEDLPPSAIKTIYTMEGVLSSLWCHLETVDLGEGANAISYCSFASHTTTEIDDETEMRCRLMVGQMQQFASSFSKSN